MYLWRDLNPHASRHHVLSVACMHSTTQAFGGGSRSRTHTSFRTADFKSAAIPLCDSSKNKNKNAEITRLYGISFVTLSSRCNPKGSSLIHKLPEWTAQSVRHRYLLFRVEAVLPYQRYNRLSNFPRPCGPFTDANLLGASFNQIHSSLRLFWILHSLKCGELGNLLLPLVVRALHL